MDKPISELLDKEARQSYEEWLDWFFGEIDELIPTEAHSDGKSIVDPSSVPEPLDCAPSGASVLYVQSKQLFPHDHTPFK